jgi:hypothetical protein
MIFENMNPRSFRQENDPPITRKSVFDVLHNVVNPEMLNSPTTENYWQTTAVDGYIPSLKPVYATLGGFNSNSEKNINMGRKHVPEQSSELLVSKTKIDCIALNHVRKSLDRGESTNYGTSPVSCASSCCGISGLNLGSNSNHSRSCRRRQFFNGGICIAYLTQKTHVETAQIDE